MPIIQTEAEWLTARRFGIGASDASCVVGANPWKSNFRLWQEKTGRIAPDDISGKPAVQYGKSAEQHLRELFALDYPQYEITYSQYGMIANISDCPWLFATLDGELRIGDRHGVLEIKTTEIQRPEAWKEWEDKIPHHYYVQVLHQLLATGYDFAVVKAQIKWHKAGAMQITTRHYNFDRKDLKDDLAYLLDEERKFWTHVQNGTPPAQKLPQI